MGSHGPQPKHNVSKPPQQKKSIFSKVGGAPTYFHEPFDPCSIRREGGVKVNNKEELMANDHTSINVGKHTSKDHTYYILIRRSSLM